MTPDTTGIRSTIADLPDLEQAVHLDERQVLEAKQAVDAASAYLKEQEEQVTNEALDDPQLTNDVKRKAAIAKALRDDTALPGLRKTLSDAQHAYALAQLDLAAAERRLKGATHALRALGDLAHLEAANVQLQAFHSYLKAAQTQLQARLTPQVK